MLKVANSVINASQITGVLPVVNGGTGVTTSTGTGNTVLSAAPTLSGNVSLSTGNLVQGTAAKGINFTANTPAAGMTSQLLNWYEEGTWTATQGAGLTVVGAFSASGTYTRIGRQVTVRGLLYGATSIAAASGTVMCGGMPFSASGSGLGTAADNNAAVGSVLYISGANLLSVSTIGASPAIHFGATYFV